MLLAVPAIGRGALHHVGIAHGPLVGLLRAHRATDHQREAAQAELLGDELMLRAHVVADAHAREVGHAVRRRRVVRRGREAVADLVDDDDEVLVRIERAALADIAPAR